MLITCKCLNVSISEENGHLDNLELEKLGLCSSEQRDPFFREVNNFIGLDSYRVGVKYSIFYTSCRCFNKYYGIINVCCQIKVVAHLPYFLTALWQRIFLGPSYWCCKPIISFSVIVFTEESKYIDINIPWNQLRTYSVTFITTSSNTYLKSDLWACETFYSVCFVSLWPPFNQNILTNDYNLFMTLK